MPVYKIVFGVEFQNLERGILINGEERPNIQGFCTTRYAYGRTSADAITILEKTISDEALTFVDREDQFRISETVHIIDTSLWETLRFLLFRRQLRGATFY